MLGLAGGVLFKDEVSRGPHIPNRVRNAKSRNITPVYTVPNGMSGTNHQAKGLAFHPCQYIDDFIFKHL